MKFTGELAKLDCVLALERLGGDEELLREVAKLFLDEYPMLMREMRAAVVSNDSEALQRAAHSLKGSVSNFGADGVYQAAFALERLGRAGDLGAAWDCIERLDHSLTDIRPALVELAGE